MTTATKEKKATKTNLKLQPLGDRVLFSAWAGETFKVGDEELLLMKEDDILAILED